MAIKRSTPSKSKRKQTITISFNGVLDVVQTRAGLEYRLYSDFQSAIRGGMDREEASIVFFDRAKQTGCAGTCYLQTVVGTTKIYCFDASCGAATGCSCHLLETSRSVEGGTQTIDLGIITKSNAIVPKPNARYQCKCK